MRAHRRIRRRAGFSVVEITIVTVILAFLLIASFQMITTANAVYTQQSIKQFTRMQAQKILDAMAEDFRYSAGFNYLQVDANGQNPVRLTKWNASNQLCSNNSSTTSYTFNVVSTGTSTGPTGGNCVAFERCVKAYVVDVGYGTSYPGYLIVDWEPQQAAALSSDVSGNGNTTNYTDMQPQRMDDDPTRMYIIYRTVVVKNRVVVQRVRGLGATSTVTTDVGVATTGYANTPQLVVDVGDLGPATAASTVGGTTTYPRIEISGVDHANGNTGIGSVHLRVVARGISARTASQLPEIVESDLSTDVTPSCAAPPF